MMFAGSFDMNDKTRLVLNGWFNLEVNDRRELEEAMRRYRTAPESERQDREFNERYVQKMMTGPLGNPCACCGRR